MLMCTRMCTHAQARHFTFYLCAITAKLRTVTTVGISEVKVKAEVAWTEVAWTEVAWICGGCLDGGCLMVRSPVRLWDCGIRIVSYRAIAEMTARCLLNCLALCSYVSKYFFSFSFLSALPTQGGGRARLRVSILGYTGSCTVKAE